MNNNNQQDFSDENSNLEERLLKKSKEENNKIFGTEKGEIQEDIYEEDDFRYSSKGLKVAREITLLRQIQAIVSKETVLWKRNFFNFFVMFFLSIVLGKISFFILGGFFKFFF